jgi:glycosyltransferase involved in cell wall biosynthesis
MSTIEHTTTHVAPPQAPDEATKVLVSVVIPCLNEEENIEACVTSALTAMREADIPGEVVVADNASEDRSAELATAAGARVVHEPRRGYGSAYMAGFAAARGEYIIMGDADLTYDFEEIPRFVEKLEAGAELVMGDRMKNIHPGAMPWHHRYIGNPVLTGILNTFFRTGVSDAHCGMRALRRDVLPRLDLRTTGMEFASEMVIRASKENLRIAEFPIEYHPRGGESKLSSWRDGWRHLRFLLVHSPTHLFILPGVVMALLGGLIGLLVLWQIHLFGRAWDLHTEIAGALLTIVGTQIVALGLAAHAYGKYFMGERDPWFDRMRDRFRLEHGLLAGGFITLTGFVLGAVILGIWIDRDFGTLSEERLAVLAATLIIVGLQVFFSSFLLSILGLRRRG